MTRRRAARAARPSAGVFGDDRREFGGRVPGRRDRRRPAGRALRPGLPRARAAPRTRTAPAASCCSTPARAAAARAGPADDASPGGSDERVDYALEASDLRHRRGRAVAARRARRSSSAAAETEALAASLEGNDGVYFVPALTGLGSPHWDPYARGTIVGLTRGTRPRAPRARRAGGDRLPDRRRGARAGGRRCGVALEELRADGGAAANGWLMQFQADVLGVPGGRPGDRRDDGALGAAYLAGITAGCWTEADTRAMWREARRYRAAHGRGRAPRAAGAMASCAGARRADGCSRTRLRCRYSLPKRISDDGSATDRAAGRERNTWQKCTRSPSRSAATEIPFETGKMAKQASGSVLVAAGDTASSAPPPRATCATSTSCRSRWTSRSGCTRPARSPARSSSARVAPARRRR